MEKQMNFKVRIILEVALAIVAGYFMQAHSPAIPIAGPESPTHTYDEATLAVLEILFFVALCFISARFSRSILLRKRYLNFDGKKFPDLSNIFRGPFWGEREPLQDEINMAIHGFSAGIGAIALGLLLQRALSLGGVMLIAWATGDFLATRAFWRKRG
jgi:hypothetical protein